MSISRQTFAAPDYDLDATLTSGQAFRWRRREGAWEGIVSNRWVRLVKIDDAIDAQTCGEIADWDWLRHYLQLDVDLSSIISTFPDDEPMRTAVRACRGLRLLRQEPWECLASFILSSTKQIVQIQQIVALLCERFGDPAPAPVGAGAYFSFPPAARLAACREADLRACKMGFRAPYLRSAAEMVSRAEVDLAALSSLPVDQARDELMKLPGVGRKIADCVLLFAYGFPQAFPVDVWVMKALQTLYFPRRRVRIERLRRFSQTHFGPQAGYAQQYLFHYMRTRKPQAV